MQLAIVIPFYKIDYFDITLESLALQTDKRFNVYIGDDASPHNLKKLLKQYKGKFKFTYNRFQYNLGGQSLVKQWCRCIDLTQGEPWIMILGDDDYLEDNLVENWYNEYLNFSGKSNVIRFATKPIDLINNNVSKQYFHPKWESSSDFFKRKFLGETRSSLSEYIFKREVFELYGFYDYPLGWHSDDRAWLEFSNHLPIFSINKSFVFIRISTASITGKSNNLNEKRKATIEFYRFIILKKNFFLDSKIKYGLVRHYESALRNSSGLSFFDFLFLFKVYLKTDLVKLFSFLKRSIKAFFQLKLLRSYLPFAR